MSPREQSQRTKLLKRVGIVGDQQVLTVRDQEQINCAAVRKTEGRPNFERSRAIDSANWRAIVLTQGFRPIAIEGFHGAFTVV